MKVLAIILGVMGVIGLVGSTTAQAPIAHASTLTTSTTTTTQDQQDRFDRPPRMAASLVPVAAVAKPHPVAKKAATKPQKTAVRHVKKVVVRTYARTYSKAPVGILPSAYRGSYYDARYESFRRCVVNRESHGNYGARNPNSSASGAYQFLAAWTRTIQKWTGEYVPIYRMSRYAQDLAFWRAFDHGRGASNWAGGGYRC